VERRTTTGLPITDLRKSEGDRFAGPEGTAGAVLLAGAGAESVADMFRKSKLNGKITRNVTCGGGFK
jgi:hypothetical protein